MKYKTIFFYLIVIIGFACSNNKFAKKDNKSETLVLIFKNAPDHSMFTFPSGAKMAAFSKNLISYIGTDGLLKEYTPQKTTDTLVINKLRSEYLEILHKFQGFEDIYYLFNTGDTIEFNYNENRYPIARSYKSENLTVQYNFQANIKNRVVNFGFESISLITCPHICLLNKLKVEKPNVYNTIFKERHVDFIDLGFLKSDYSNYIRYYQNSLDSLYKARVLPSVFFNYYNYLLKRRKMIYSISEYKYQDTNNMLERIDSLYKNSFNDSLIDYISYNRLVHGYIFDVLCKSETINLIKDNNGSYYDNRQVFDKISKIVDIAPKTKNLLLYYSLENIIENFSGEDIQTYLLKYRELTNDTVKTNYLIAKNKLDFNSGNDLILTSYEGIQTTFNDLLSKHKGKLLYVDFWASWCAPCRKSMPDANILRAEYKDKDIVFIYLAKDDEKDAWNKAVQKLGTNIFGENYFIENTKVSKMIEDLEITSIPRYILFDKTGTVVYKNAPRPGNPEIRNILNNYLKE